MNERVKQQHVISHVVFRPHWRYWREKMSQKATQNRTAKLEDLKATGESQEYLFSSSVYSRTYSSNASMFPWKKMMKTCPSSFKFITVFHLLLVPDGFFINFATKKPYRGCFAILQLENICESFPAPQGFQWSNWPGQICALTALASRCVWVKCAFSYFLSFATPGKKNIAWWTETSSRGFCIWLLNFFFGN